MGDEKKPERTGEGKKLSPPPLSSPLVYNAKSQATVPGGSGKKLSPAPKDKLTRDQLDFLRKAEQDNDVDVGEEFGLGMQHVSSKRTNKNKLGSDLPKRANDGRQPMWSTPSLDSEALREVADDVDEIGTNSSSEQSAVTSKSAAAQKKSRLRKFFRDKKIYPDNKEGGEEDGERKDSDGRKVSAEEASKIRGKLAKRQARFEHCTYQLLVIIMILRLLTTLAMVYEYEEFRITLEYLLRLRKVNCLQVYESGFDIWPIILLAYFTACCVLPALASRDLAQACIYWLVIQQCYTGYRFFYLQQYLFFREIIVTRLSLILFGLHTLLDVVSYTVVMIRYYYWANPSLERHRYSNTMLGDYLVNEYIQFMVQSSFIRKKTAVQRATAFQIMTVVRKLKDKYRASGDGPSEQAIQKEVKSAIHALQDWKKFPALRIIHSFEVKEKIMREKLKLRRQRIRDMKDRFHRLLAEHQQLLKKQKKERLVEKEKQPGKVVLNSEGQAIGVNSPDMYDTVKRIRELKKKENMEYSKKRGKLMQSNKKPTGKK